MANDVEQVKRVARAMESSAAVCSSGRMLAAMDFTDYEWRWLARAAIEAMQTTSAYPAAGRLADLLGSASQSFQTVSVDITTERPD